MNKKNFKKTISILATLTIFASTSTFAMDTNSFNKGIAQGIQYYNDGLYELAKVELQRFCESNWGSLTDEQQKFASECLEKAKKGSTDTVVLYTSNSSQSSATTTTMSREEFDKGMAKGIEYFDKKMYYEAKDEFQWFCDYNWGRMNKVQQQYALDYLGGTKAKIELMEKYLTKEEFDEGMSIGIEFFNDGYYADARDEFQWFCDHNWGKLNKVQQQYALDYLNGASKRADEYIFIYKITDLGLETSYIHPSKLKGYQNDGWSTSKPAKKYKVDKNKVKETGLTKLKKTLKRPSSLEVYSVDIVEHPEYAEGVEGATVYVVTFDCSALNGYGGYSRGSESFGVWFDAYTGKYY